jgi:hypothetical protein
MSRTPKVNAGRPWTILEERRGIELYELGFSLSEVGELIGRPATSVTAMLERNGIERRKRGTPKGAVKVDAMSVRRCAFLYERMEMSINEICAVTGLEYTSVRNRLLHANVRLRSNSESQRLRARRAAVTSWTTDQGGPDARSGC